MTDATTERQSAAPDHASRVPHVHRHPAPARRLSLLEASAGARMSGALLVVGLLWAGVYWALH